MHLRQFLHPRSHPLVPVAATQPRQISVKNALLYKVRATLAANQGDVSMPIKAMPK
jgi:hypothetical protein